MPMHEDGHEATNIELKRPKPRRLFSFDSIKTGSSRLSSSEFDVAAKGVKPVNPFDLSNVEEREDELETAGRNSERVQGNSESVMSVPGPGIDPFGDQASSPGLEPVRPVPLKPKRSLTTDLQQNTFSPTRARWESLRQHVLPGTSRSFTPPPRPGSAQGSIISLPTRSNTPKPSRLGRLGLRQVVDQAQDQANDIRRLGEEISRACAAARYPDPQKYAKERDNHGISTMGTATMTATHVSTAKKFEHQRRQQSASTFSLAANFAGASTPSLRYLHQVIMHYSGPDGSSVARCLPREGQVLSTLLLPFLQPALQPEEEKVTALETFELLLSRWAPEDEVSVSADNLTYSSLTSYVRQLLLAGFSGARKQLVIFHLANIAQGFWACFGN